MTTTYNVYECQTCMNEWIATENLGCKKCSDKGEFAFVNLILEDIFSGRSLRTVFTCKKCEKPTRLKGMNHKGLCGACLTPTTN